MKIALIHGGTSSEHKISTINAGYIKEALALLGHTTYMLNYDVSFIGALRAIAPDLVWICVQGKRHGDGTIQSILDFLGLTYTGSGALAAQIINNKIVCKELFELAGVRTPRWRALTLEQYQKGAFDFSRFGFPFVAKAPSQGGSFGIELIRSSGDIKNISNVFEYDNPCLIEEYIPGHAVTAGLLEHNGNLAVFPAVGVRTDGEEYRYELVKPDNPRPVTRCDFPASTQNEIDEFARTVFRVTRARGFARVDFMVSMDNGLPYVLEINAVPGMQPANTACPSLYPLGAAEYGISYGELARIIVNNSTHIKKG